MLVGSRLFVSLSVTVAATLSCPTAHAQFNLGRELQKLLTIPNSQCAKLKQWVSTAPASSQGAGRAVEPLLPLVADEVFSPIFGKTYDALTMEDFREFQRTTRPACQKEGNFTPAEWQIVNSAWNEYQHQRLSQALVKARSDKAELQQAVTELDSLQPTEADYARLVALSKQGASKMRGTPHEQMKLFFAALKNARERVAEPVLSARVDSSVASASGQAGYETLQRLRTELFQPDIGLPPTHPALSKLLARQGEIENELADQATASARALPSGLVGLEAGKSWLQDLDRQWQRLLGGMPSRVRDVRQRVLTDRQKLLAAAKPELTARLQRSKSQDEMQALLGRYLIDAERNGGVGAELLAVANDRNDALERADAIKRGGGGQALAPASSDDDEAPVRKKSGGKREALAKGEPSEEDMYDLLKSKFDAAAGRMRDIQERCAGGNFARNSVGGAMDAMMCLGMMPANAMGAGQAPKITSFRKLGCAKASGKPGYVCDYIAQTSHPINQQMGSILGGMMDSAGAGQARFLDAGDRWIAYFGEKN